MRWTEMPRDNNHCSNGSADRRPACPVCGGRLGEIGVNLQCERCHTICESCCEGQWRWWETSSVSSPMILR